MTGDSGEQREHVSVRRVHLAGALGIAVLMLMACLSGCADEGGTVSPGASATPSEGAPTDLQATGDSDATPPPLAETDEDVSGSGPSGGSTSRGVDETATSGRDDACASDADCDPGDACIRLSPQEDSRTCVRFCLSSADCDEPKECVLLRFAGVDAVAACLDPDLCIDRDGDGYGYGPGCLGPDCDDTDPEVNPGREEWCDGRDTSCRGAIDLNPVWGTVGGESVRIGEDCETESPGICSAGRWSCVLGETLCTRRLEPEPVERCDALDRTCDGFVDRDPEGEPLARECYGGPEGTAGRGRCRAGMQQCQEGEWPATCPGEVLPREERCNGEDDDCDGVVDNVDASLLAFDRLHCGACGNVCPEHLDCREGECRCPPGLTACGTSCVDLLTSRQHCGDCERACGERFACEAGVCVRTACDPGTTRSCESPCGEGVETCTEDGWRDCTAPLPNAVRGCDSICETGSQTCTPDGWSTCTARLPAPERCNLFDDLCDGTLDTGLSCRQAVHRLLRPTSGNWAFTEIRDEALPGFVLHAEDVFWLYASNAEGRAVPFFRCFNPEVGGTGRHFLTTDPACERWQPEHLERAIGFLSPNALANTTPLYRSWQQDISTHFYTTNFVEHQARINGSGARDEGIVGHVWNSP